MRYFLIDFGASEIKTAFYEKGKLKPYLKFISPFYKKDSISRNELWSLLISIAQPCDRIIISTILGGGWVVDTYYSWKSTNNEPKKHCLISGLFADQPAYHMHVHHGGAVEGLQILGDIAGILVYSALGDTPCVIESLDLQDNECAINMGTGSQIISNKEVISYIPAGRAFNCFAKFFESMGVDFFGTLNTITPENVYESTLDIDLKVFSQARGFYGGGFIIGIMENNFNMTNLLSSLLRCFVLQYDINYDKVRLVGGIPQKLPILKTLFEHYTGKEVVVDNNAGTLQGMVKMIDRYLGV